MDETRQWMKPQGREGFLASTLISELSADDLFCREMAKNSHYSPHKVFSNEVPIETHISHTGEAKWDFFYFTLFFIHLRRGKNFPLAAVSYTPPPSPPLIIFESRSSICLVCEGKVEELEEQKGEVELIL